MSLDFFTGTVLARLDASLKALLVLGAALLAVGAVFALFWWQERKSNRVYRKQHPPPPAEPGRTPGLSLAEEKRRQEQKEPGGQDS